MATLARLSRRILPRTLSDPPLVRAFYSRSSPIGRTAGTTSSDHRESADRVKWDYRGQRKSIPLGQWAPKIAVDAYGAPNVIMSGQVVVYDGASIWNGAVLRGDLNKITVGFCSNVQERCVIHAAWSSPTGLPAETSIERFVTIGAYSLLRSCTIEPECILASTPSLWRVLWLKRILSLKLGLWFLQEGEYRPASFGLEIQQGL